MTLLLSAFWTAWAIPTASAKNVALVIGNGAYDTMDPLPQAPVDAKLIARTLQRLGFDTTLIIDEGTAATASVLATFRSNAQGADLALVYYAGHGAQSEHVNYLLPVDATLTRDDDLSSDRLVADLASAEVGLGVIVLDACRSDPFPAAPGTGRTRTVRTRRLEPRDPRATNGDIVLAYPVPAGVDTPDNGRYAKALARNMTLPCATMPRVFERVNEDLAGIQKTWIRGSYGPVAHTLHLTTCEATAASTSPEVQAYGHRREGEARQAAGRPSDALQAYKAASKLGDAVAMVQMGLASQQGWGGIPIDYGRAMAWYQGAAQLGNPQAMNNIGALYHNGLGVTKDYVQAKTWYLRAAEYNRASAMENLGSLYYHGRGVAKNYAEARQWFTRAANLGSVGAMFNLGILYEHGRGVARDQGIAVRWYRKAAWGGDEGAKAALRDLGATW